MPDFHTATREELLDIARRQQEQIDALLGREAVREAMLSELQARVATLEEENTRLRAGGGGGGKAVPPWVKANRPTREPKARKRRRQAFVRRTETPDERRVHAVSHCPKCGRALTGGWVHRTRQVIEVSVTYRVIEHQVLARRCGICGTRALPTLEAGELGVQGQRRFGVSVQALVALLHIRFRVPIREIRQLLEELCGLHVSDGEIVGLLQGVARAGERELARLQEAVRGSPVVCADETGWRQDGKNGYLWTFATPTVRYFQYRGTRAGTVPKEVLGEDFNGIVSCDCYAGYNRLAADKQRCWAHLLRDLHALQEAHPDQPDVGAWVAAIQALYAEAKAFVSASWWRRRKQRRTLEDRLDRLVRALAQQPTSPQQVLAQRIRGHLLEWFPFVEHPEVPSTNNLAERSLRPAVIARKISGGTRSDTGSETQAALMSLFGTWKVRGQDSLEACTHLLLTPAPTAS